MASSTVQPIRICTFNMHGFENSCNYLLTLLNTHDLVFVQELRLDNHEMHLLHSLSDEFIIYARTGMSNAVQNQILRGRPYGGIAVFLHKELPSYVTCCTYNNNARVICVRYTSENMKLLLFGHGYCEIFPLLCLKCS